jgi:hypothetical protein
MTLVETRNQILEHFQKEDFFSLKDHSGKIMVSKNQADIKNELIKLALRHLEETKLVSHSKNEVDEIWVLEVPLNLQGQEIMVSFPTAELISTLLNRFKEVLGTKSKRMYPTDVMNITEQDILQLCIVCQQLLEKEDRE